MDARMIQKACRRFAGDEGLLDRSPFVQRVAESGSGERAFEFSVGDWVVVLDVDAEDLVIVDIRVHL